MTATRRRRTEPTQPELPLRQPPVRPDPVADQGHPDPVPAHRRAQGPAGDEPRAGREWRLDEHTRQVGLRGVAMARARLRRSEAAGIAPGGEPQTRRPSGRAA